MISMFFRNPEYFLLMPIVAALGLFWINIRRRKAPLNFSNTESFAGLKRTFRQRIILLPVVLRTLALIFVLMALARPQSPLEETEVVSEGIDIVLALDVSTSMLAEDFVLNGLRENRLDVVKEVVKGFISGRQSDRIGMVVFSGRPYTVCPLTLDYPWLETNLDRVKIGMIEDGTAIGSGITTALNRIKDTQAKGKVIILLTDGINNAGKISPIVAAEAAKAMGVKIYAIGAGTKGYAPYPFKDSFGRTVYKDVKIDIDDESLGKIAEVTGGQYFRAQNTESLKNIYKEIDRLEKVPMKEKGYMEFRELFLCFLVPGILLFLLEIFISNTYLRMLP